MMVSTIICIMGLYLDVIYELKEFGINIDIFDPQANKDEVNNEYHLSLIETLSTNKYDAIIHAVAHNDFKNLNFKNLLNTNGVIYDVKSTLPKSMVDGRL